MRIGFLCLILATAPVLCAQSSSARRSGPGRDYIGKPEAIAAGKQLYVGVCSACHGVSGKGGRGPNLVTGRNVRRASDQQLFDAIKNGVPGTDMPPSPFETEQVWRVAAFVRSLSAPAFRQPLPGDPEEGRRVYHAQARCDRCHMIGGRGGYLGPDLTNAGMSGNLEFLREQIVDPNSRITDRFQPVVVTLADGSRVEGVAKYNSNYAVAVLDAKGSINRIEKRTARSVEFPGRSWMPSDYGQRLTPKQLDDLLAFLSRQTIRAAGN